MSEKITPLRVLDTLATRKPSEWTECLCHLEPTKGQVKYLQALPVYYADAGYNPIDELSPTTSDGQKHKMSNRFLLSLADGTLCYVNTEGYSYCRYALRLKREIIFPEGLPNYNMPSIPSVRIEEELPVNIKTPLEESPNPNAKMLVLASKALICYLEYKEYPEGTKLLTKMLAEAIKDYENE